MNNRIYRFGGLLIAALLLVTIISACSGNRSLPASQASAGPSQTVDVQIPLPDTSAGGVALNIEFLSGVMKLAPGASETLASGTATYNTATFAPKYETAGVSFTLRQGDLQVGDGVNCPGYVENEWDLRLADTPMSLNIHAGAYTGHFELGGLSLETLTINDGGSDFSGAFSTPNHIVMSSFSYATKASKTVWRGLANANFEQMIFSSGAGDYTLSFDGDLRRDASVMIDSGLSTVNLIVPAGVNSRVAFEGSLASVNAEGEWAQDGEVYTLSGSGPSLSITVKMDLGTLNLKNG